VSSSSAVTWILVTTWRTVWVVERSEAAVRNAFTSKRLTFNPMSIQEPKGREVVLKAADYLAKNRVLEKPITQEFLG
jgi:hypothetical protein